MSRSAPPADRFNDESMPTTTADIATAPRQVFSPFNATAVIIGIVVGIGIFGFPPLVAASAASKAQFLGFWLAGGLISLLGALCYAELATARPHAGGEYHFLRQAFGAPPAFLFAWARITVIQTGSIAVAAFIVGDHLSLLLPLGSFSSGTYAALVVVVLTALNIWGTSPAKDAQTLLAVAVVAGLIAVAAIALFGSAGSARAPVSAPTSPPGLAMIFVLLTYGGWNEAAYLSAEVRDPRRNIVRSLVLALALITTIYFLINLAFVQVLGLEELRAQATAGVALTERIFGNAGGLVMAAVVVVAALSTVNASILTGVRATYALGQDFVLFRPLGRWHSGRNTPVNALCLQGAIALLLVMFGTVTAQGIGAMVEYTAPVFWFFLGLTTLALFVFRRRDRLTDRPYSVPLYPLPPLLFFGACVYMFHASVMHTGMGAWAGIGIVLAGVPLYAAVRRYEQ